MKNRILLFLLCSVIVSGSQSPLASDTLARLGAGQKTPKTITITSPEPDGDGLCLQSSSNLTKNNYELFLQAFTNLTAVSYLLPYPFDYWSNTTSEVEKEVFTFGLQWRDVSLQRLALNTSAPGITAPTRNEVIVRANGPQWKYNNKTYDENSIYGLLFTTSTENKTQYNGSSAQPGLSETVWDVLAGLTVEPDSMNTNAPAYLRLDALLSTLDDLVCTCGNTWPAYYEGANQNCDYGLVLTGTHIQLVSLARTAQTLLLTRFPLNKQTARLTLLQNLEKNAMKFLQDSDVFQSSGENAYFDFGFQILRGKPTKILEQSAGTLAAEVQILALLTFADEIDFSFSGTAYNVVWFLFGTYGVKLPKDDTYEGIGDGTNVETILSWSTVLALNVLADAYNTTFPSRSDLYRNLSTNISSSKTITSLVCVPNVTATVLQGNSDSLASFRVAKEPFSIGGNGTLCLPQSPSVAATSWYILVQNNVNPLRNVAAIPIPTPTITPTPGPPSPTPAPPTPGPTPAPPTPTPTATPAPPTPTPTPTPAPPTPTPTPTPAPPTPTPTTTPAPPTPTPTPTPTQTPTPAQPTPSPTPVPPTPPPTPIPSNTSAPTPTPTETYTVRPAPPMPPPPSKSDAEVYVWLAVVGTLVIVITTVIVIRYRRVSRGYLKELEDSPDRDRDKEKNLGFF